MQDFITAAVKVPPWPSVHKCNGMQHTTQWWMVLVQKQCFLTCYC